MSTNLHHRSVISMFVQQKVSSWSPRVDLAQTWKSTRVVSKSFAKMKGEVMALLSRERDDNAAYHTPMIRHPCKRMRLSGMGVQGNKTTLPGHRKNQHPPGLPASYDRFTRQRYRQEHKQWLSSTLRNNTGNNQSAYPRHQALSFTLADDYTPYLLPHA